MRLTKLLLRLLEKRAAYSFALLLRQNYYLHPGARLICIGSHLLLSNMTQLLGPLVGNRQLVYLAKVYLGEA